MTPLKVSPFQKTFYFEWKLNPNNSDYHMVIDQIIDGELDINRLNRSLKKMISEQYIFNSHIEEIDNEYYWILNKSLKDLKIYKKTYNPDSIKKVIAEPFDLEIGPLFRYSIFKLSENKHRFIFVMHHAIIDGASGPEIYLELSNYYNNPSYEYNLSLTEQINKFNNMREKLEDEIDKNNSENEIFWNEKLKNHSILDTSFLEDPFFKKSYLTNNCQELTNQDLLGINEIYISIKSENINRLKKKFTITPYLFSKIVFAVTLFKFSRTEKFLVAYPISIKEGMSLHFGANVNVNLLPFYIHDDIMIEEIILNTKNFLKSLKEDNKRRSYFPLYKINIEPKEKLTSISFTSAFLQNISFEFENIKSKTITRSNIALTHDFIFEYQQAENEINIRVDYKREKISEELINNFCQYYKDIYQEITTYLLSDSPDKSKKFIKDFHTLKVNNFSDNEIKKNSENIIKLFENSVKRNPDKTAVIFKNKIITYKQLDEYSNKLANYILQKFAISENTLIGISLNRSEKIIISILAIIKAGAAYIPIDTKLPIDRVKYILNDANPITILTDNQNLNTIKNLFKKEIIYLDSIDTEYEIIEQSQTSVQKTRSLNDLIYILYTSGTTGKPKGVMMDHASCVNRIQYMIEQNEMSNEDSYLFKTNITFDVSFSDIFTTLLSGAKLVITEEIFNLSEIKQLLIEHKISICHFVPSQFKIFSEELNLEMFKNLKKFQFSGEALDTSIIEQYVDNERIFLNYYGPTETGEVTLKKYTSSIEHKLTKSIIGKKFPNTNLYILDKNLKALPTGASGELFVGGISLSRGYLNMPELTHEKFIKNPYQTEFEKEKRINAHLYKTGDYVRLLPNNELEYIGRNDNQIKIRGHRIELSEIEKSINEFKGIKQSLVMGKILEKSQDQVLICYYISLQKIDPNEIIEFISSSLPDYMIPGLFIHLTEIPLNSNGKLDQNKLPMPTIEKNINHISPRNELENNMTILWQNILGISYENISMNDSFFTLGGNSINAIKLVNKIKKDLKLNISLQDVLKYKSIEKIIEISKKNNCNENSIKKLCRDHTTKYYLSFAQERLWFIDKINSGLNSYNIPMVYNLDKNFNSESLKKSAQRIINRHEILRTIIKETENGDPYQEVLSEYDLLVPIKKCTSKTELEKLIEIELNYTFEISREIPIRISILQLEKCNEIEDSYLCIAAHHIAFDGWSNEIFLKELNTYYNYFENIISKEELDELIPTLNIQYLDFSYWQKENINKNILDDQKNYWKGKLDNAESLDIHPDLVRPKYFNYQGKNLFHKIDQKLSEDIALATKKLDVTQFSFFLSSYYIMLSLISGQKDILIGTPISNRHYHQISDLIGFFVNLIPLRSQIEAEMEIDHFIKSVHSELIEAQKNQDIPFEKLVEEISTNRDQSKHPIFQVIFGMQDFSDNKIEENRSNLFTKEQNSFYQFNHLFSPAKFDLSLFIEKSKDGFLVCFNYPVNLFYDATIKNYIEIYIHILKELSNNEIKNLNKNLRLKDLNCVPNEQQKIISQIWHKPVKLECKKNTIQKIFELIAQNNPERIALICGENALTYSELNQRTNKLANFLRAHYKIEADSLIALCLDRDVNMTICILAVLKAGGAYVPIDPESPKERIKFILEDTNTKLLLTNEMHKNIFTNEILPSLDSSLEQLNTVYLESFEVIEKLSRCASDNLEIIQESNNLAYVIYTSGTTGKPKGVLIEHAAVINLIVNLNDFLFNEFGVKNINVLSIMNFAFDGHVLELSCSIFQGNCLHLIPNELRKDYYNLNNYAMNNNINLAIFPPAFLMNTELFSSDLIMIGGEKINKNILSYYLNNKRKLVNAYGPTEICVMNTFHEYTNQDEINCIGYPFLNTTGYVLNDSLQLLPIGAVGELYIGGNGVARGYLNRDSMTQEKFVSNPFQTSVANKNSINSRLYKTGDLVKILPNYELEYIGRNDAQVKIRGYRIELGEIESSLLELSEIEQAVVIIKELKDNKFLCCYYKSRTQISSEEIIKHLSKRLPEYMIPIKYLRLEEFPLNTSGKINTKALPFNFTEDRYITDNTCKYIPPQNEVEKNICEIWEEILGLDRNTIGIKDDYFNLGGNSLTAIKIINRINNKYSANLKISDLFTYKCIEEIVKVINDKTAQSEILIELNNAIKKPALFMIHPARAGCEVYTKIAKSFSNDFHCFGIDSYNMLHCKKIENLNSLATYYLEQIKKKSLQNPNQSYYLFGWSLGGYICLEIASILEMQGIKNISIYLLDTFYPDNFMLNNSIDIHIFKKEFMKEMSQKIDDIQMDKMLSNYQIENNILKQEISNKLAYSKVLLFKANQFRKNTEYDAINNLNEYTTSLPNNNILNALIYKEQLKVIYCENDTHFSIIENEKFIINEIYNFERNNQIRNNSNSRAIYNHS
ncbi:non-ribosomal peptide synthetase [Fluviispira sanaruensis]|uniref:Carrier domain-containing protein n=1 Tax=Fluviispira sanaruensis TaxID=2493639 RepID=A0A4P2VKP2_FLUSA|nr:non-ribosomal peptide synthetase [Fluviispira sanaruensis]BBH53188.1 hypothetical protein JCM31447_16310 [Fluviispira sanaruensis]